MLHLPESCLWVQNGQILDFSDNANLRNFFLTLSALTLFVRALALLRFRFLSISRPPIARTKRDWTPLEVIQFSNLFGKVKQTKNFFQHNCYR